MQLTSVMIGVPLHNSTHILLFSGGAENSVFHYIGLSPLKRHTLGPLVGGVCLLVSLESHSVEAI